MELFLVAIDANQRLVQLDAKTRQLGINGRSRGDIGHPRRRSATPYPSLDTVGRSRPRACGSGTGHQPNQAKDEGAKPNT